MKVLNSTPQNHLFEPLRFALILIVTFVSKLQVMEQFFGLVNTFLQNHRDTWKRRLGVRTYKVCLFNILDVSFHMEGMAELFK